MDSVRKLISDRLSTFRTSHQFERYAEFSTTEEFAGLVAWARDAGLRVYILGNGSNTLFARRRIRTLVLRNRLPRWMNVLDERRVEVSSANPIMTVLKHCERQRLDSFYYLASVPATIGGALAMNAGRGRCHNMVIYDFIESVTYFEDGQTHTLRRRDVQLDYRRTMFTGLHERLIVSAVLRFEPTGDTAGRIRERIDWSKRVQDHSAPNCGSVFCDSSAPLMRALRGLRWGESLYSPKVANWILNNSRSSRSIRWLIWIAKAAHVLIGKRAKVELIEVD